MFVPKIVFFDIDDTLYLKQQRLIPDSARDAIRRLQEKGIRVAIASGRSPSVLPEAAKQLIDEYGIDPVLLINGQYIRYQGEVLKAFPMQRQVLAEVSVALEQAGINHAFVSANDVAVAWEEAHFAAAAAELGLPYIVDKRHYDSQEVYQMLAFYPPEYDKAVAAMLPAHLKTVRWHQYGVDILDATGSKARGIAAVLQALGVQMEEAMAFGDGANDVEMLQAVGFGVAMGNAAPELKRLAKYVCPRADEDGIFRGLRDLGII